MRRPLTVLVIILVLSCLWGLLAGRYSVGVSELFSSVLSKITGGALTSRQEEILFLLSEVRLPRIIAAILVGAALSVSGAVYQSMFLNPLVSPGILGVLAGASFGAALGIVVLNSWVATQALAFVFSILAVVLSVALARVFPRQGMLVLILGGMISASFFNALTSLMKYTADTTSQLPELVYWLMGTFARANFTTLSHVGFIIIAGVIFLSLCGKTVNALSMGEEEALSLGVDVKRSRLLLIGCATLVSASTVVIAGTVSWVGVVIPHILRFFIGPDNRVLLPASAIGGGAYLLITDTAVRSAFTMEVPIGIVTSLAGLPLFIFAIYKNKGGWR